MKHKILIINLFFITLSLSAQRNYFTIFDTVNVEEVVVSQTTLLSDEALTDKYRNTQFNSIDKINSRLGGVAVISRGPYAMEPVLNSFTGGQINVTIDGMKMFGACTDKMDPVTSYVEPENLGRLIITQGSEGSVFGSTVGGSYNMIFSKPKLSTTPEFKIRMGSGIESVSGGISGQTKIDYSNRKLGWRLSSVYKNYPQYKDAAGSVVPFTQYRKFNLHNSFLYAIKNHNTLKMDILVDDAHDIGYPALPMDVAVAKGRVFAGEYHADNSIRKFSDLKAKVYANFVYHLMDDSNRDSLYLVENNHSTWFDSVYMKMDMPGWSKTYGAYFEGHIAFTPRQRLYIKIEDYLHNSKAEMTMHMENLSNPGEPPMYTETWPENYRHVTGFYLKNSMALNTSVTLNINARLDYATSKIISENGIRQFEILGYDISDKDKRILKSFNIDTRLGLSKNFRTIAGIGYGERPPSLSEQFGFYLFNAKDGYDYIGSPDLYDEQSVNAWINLVYVSSRLKLTWNNYYYRVYNYIFGSVQPDLNTLNLYATGVKKYTNLNYADVYSTNFQGSWEVLKSLEFLYVAKYTWGQTFEDEPLPLIAPLSNIFTLSYRKKNVFLQGEAELSSAQNRINKAFGEHATPAYQVFAVRSGYHLMFQSVSLNLSLGVENLLNKAYSTHLDWGNYYRPGRNFYLYLKADF